MFINIYIVYISKINIYTNNNFYKVLLYTVNKN